MIEAASITYLIWHQAHQTVEVLPVAIPNACRQLQVTGGVGADILALLILGLLSGTLKEVGNAEGSSCGIAAPTRQGQHE